MTPCDSPCFGAWVAFGLITAGLGKLRKDDQSEQSSRPAGWLSERLMEKLWEKQQLFHRV